ncbi:MAG TPA: DoxX family protein [Methylomirabilota bacterium]|nr:DoxX family protein [Methylomirabilota bacterium]
MAYALWIIQTLLGLLFLFSGSMKFVMSVAEMTKDTPWMAGWFLHFIGVMEILGGLGLILPSALRIRPGLTPLAAAGLVIIMIGATVITLGTMGIGPAMLPLIVGILCVFVAYGRWRLAPLSPRR